MVEEAAQNSLLGLAGIGNVFTPQAVTQQLSPLADSIFSGLESALFTGLRDFSARSFAVALLNNIQNSLISSAAGGITAGLRGLLGFQEGGVVPGAPHQARLAVVHGGEVISNPARGQSTGSNVTINIPVTGDVSRQTREVLLQLTPEIAEAVRIVNLESGRA